MLYFKINQIVNNNEIMNEFKVAPQGGMRRSIKTNTLVLISDHTKTLYDDKWRDDILYYTGMGKNGDQDLYYKQNKTLTESRTNGVEIHVFEVFKSTEYVYEGVFSLCDDPFQEIQNDENGKSRKVWIYPLKQEKSSSIPKSYVEALEDTKSRKVSKLSLDDLKQKAEDHSSKSASCRSVTSTKYIRDPYVAEYAKRRAKGICQLCGNPAPFTGKDGSPYLESHHIEWLSEGGEDTIENTVALCPNCHKKMHIINDIVDKMRLKDIAKRVA